MTTVAPASRFWKKSFLTAPRHEPQRDLVTADHARGWNCLPPELVDNILGYLSDDLPTLKACSLTCKTMLCSARPLISGWLTLPPSQNRRLNARSKKSLLKRSKEAPDYLAGCQGRFKYTKNLVVRLDYDLPLARQSLQPYIPHFYSIEKLQTLAIGSLDIRTFMPMFDDCFGMFTRSLRGLSLKDILDPECQLLCFVSQFPMLEDLSIQSCYSGRPYYGRSPPLPQKTPPLRGHLKLSITANSPGLCTALAGLPGGLNFTSFELEELKAYGNPEAVIAACQFTLKSVSYTWTNSLGKRHSIPSE